MQRSLYPFVTCLLLIGLWWVLAESPAINEPRAQIESWREWETLERWSWARLDAVNQQPPPWSLRASAEGVWVPISVNDNRLLVTLRRNFSGGRALQGRTTLTCRLRSAARYRLVGRIDADRASVWLQDAAGRVVCEQSTVELQRVAMKTFPLM